MAMARIWLEADYINFIDGCCFSYAMFQGGFVSWFLFYAFLPFVLYAGLLALYPLRSFQASRQMDKTQLHAGTGWA